MKSNFSLNTFPVTVRRFEFSTNYRESCKENSCIVWSSIYYSFV